MPGVRMIQFTQDQVRTLTGVSAESVRHWRKAVPYLSAKTGKMARFSFTDVVGLAVTAEVIRSLGVHIGTVSGGVDSLFRLLGRLGPGALKNATILVTQHDALVYRPEGRGLRLSGPAVVVPLEPFTTKIQNQMVPTAIGPGSATRPLAQKVRRKA
jgi:hypothetical protein